jgi:hypothetical protein
MILMPNELRHAITGLRQDIRELRGQLETAITRIRALEAGTPQARQLQAEADLAAADLAESGHDNHGSDCQCPYCYADPDGYHDYDPGPDCDDQGGMPGYQHPPPGNGEVWPP